MITPVIQEATEAPQPIIPPPSPQRTGRSPLVIALIVVGVILLPLILLLAGLIALRAGVETTVSEVVAQGEPFDMNRDVDMEMQVEAVLESGPTVVLSENGYPWEDAGVQEGSVQHVATVTSPDGVSDLYRYQAILLNSPFQDVMDCLGLSQGLNASASCRGLDETQPLVFWGTGDRPSGFWYSLAVAGLPLEATRLVTETGTGRLVGSDIVNGVSFQEWPAGEAATGRQFGEAVRTDALDAQGTVVWTQFGGN